MGKKKKKDKPGAHPAERLVELLEQDDPPDLAAEAARLGLESTRFEAAFGAARKLLERGPDPRALVELPAVFQTAFLRIAERDEDDELISDLVGLTPDRDVQKDAKRVLHHLRSRGVAVELPKASCGSVLDRVVRVEEKPLPCYLSPVSGNGGRMLLMARYTHGGVAVHQAEMTDEQGLVQFAGGTIGRNRYRQMNQEMAADPAGKLLEIGYAEARWHLARAVDRNHESDKAPPEEYLQASGDLGEVDPGAAPPAAEEHFAAQKLADRAGLAARAAELLDLPEFADWLPDEDTIETIDEKIKQVEASLLIINEQQRIDQVQRIIDGGVELMLADESKRNRYRERLLDNALYLQRSDRPEQASLAAAAAWQLLDEGFEPAHSQFFSQLCKKLFRSAEEIVARMGPAGQTEVQTDPERNPGNLIITP